MTLPNRVSRNESPPPDSNFKGVGGSVSKRCEFSARTKAQAWKRANGMCEGMVIFEEYFVSGGRIKQTFTRCRAPIDIGNFHYDHVNPDWFSKDNELDNCQVLCHSCHKTKTAQDIKKIAKTKRIIKKRTTKRKSKFRGWRKMNGDVVRT